MKTFIKWLNRWFDFGAPVQTVISQTAHDRARDVLTRAQKRRAPSRAGGNTE